MPQCLEDIENSMGSRLCIPSQKDMLLALSSPDTIEMDIVMTCGNKSRQMC